MLNHIVDNLKIIYPSFVFFKKKIVSNTNYEMKVAGTRAVQYQFLTFNSIYNPVSKNAIVVLHDNFVRLYHQIHS